MVSCQRLRKELCLLFVRYASHKTGENGIVGVSCHLHFSPLSGILSGCWLEYKGHGDLAFRALSCFLLEVGTFMCERNIL